jgi:hypothetical protein
MAIGQMIGLVNVQQSLHVIVAGGNASKAQGWKSNRFLIDDRRFAGNEAVHIDSEELLRIGLVSDLKARLFIAFGRQQDIDASVQRLLALLGSKGDLEAKFRPGATRGLGGLGDSKGCEEYSNDSKNQQKPTHSFVSSRGERPKLAYLAKLKPEFDKRNTKVMGLSFDFVDNHKRRATTSRKR